MSGLLQYGEDEARLTLETQSEGYFNNDMLLEQVERALTIFEAKYPQAQGMFIFDNAPSHMKCSDDALNPEKMNVKDGGKQPRMRDTMWNGAVQQMVTAESEQKGMRTVLQERGVNTEGMNASMLRERLREYEVKTLQSVSAFQNSCQGGRSTVPQRSLSSLDNCSENYIQCPSTQSLEATVYTRTIVVGPHHKAHHSPAL